MLCKLRRSYFILPFPDLIGTVLVLGMCFFAGGLRFAEQGFDASEEFVSSLWF